MIYVGIAGGLAVVSVLLFVAARHLEAPPGAAVPVVAAAAAVAAAFAPGAPTGVEPLDLLLRAGLGAAAVWCAAVTSWVVLWTAAVVAGAAIAAGGTSSAAELAAGAGIGAAVAPRLAGAKSSLVQGLTGGLAVQGALRLEDLEVTGTSALFAAVALVPLLAAGWRHAPRRIRRPALLAVGAYVLLAVVGSVSAAIAAASSVDDVSDATAAAERGIDLLGDDDGGSAEALAEASDRFATVRDRFDALWARPARLVPFVAQQTRAVRTMADVGAELSDAAGSAAGVDLDSVQPHDGAIDLAAFADAMVPVRDADERLRSATSRLDDVHSPWLVAPVADRYDRLAERVGDAAVTASIARDVGDVLPAILGGEGERRYLLLLQQPAEARGSGGLPGNWGEIVAVDGRLDLVASGRISDLDNRGTPPADRRIESPDGHRQLYAYEAFQDVLWQNTTIDPDFRLSADIARQLWEQSGGAPIDGVLSVDPFAIRSLLQVTGPLTLSNGAQLGADAIVPYLLNEQYAAIEDDAERVDFLGEAVDLSWSKLTTGTLPGPRLLADAFAPAVDGRHLLFTTFDDDEARVLERLGVDGSVPDPTSDGVGIVTVNVGQNKIDYFLTRSSRYDTTWDPDTGNVQGTYSVTLENTAPAEGQPDAVVGYGGPLSTDPNLPVGTNLLQAYVYTALQPTAVRVDGEPAAVGFQRDDRGWYVSVLVLPLPPGGASTIEVDVAGTLDDEDEWRLDVVRQPAVNDDRLVVDVRVDGDAATAPESQLAGAEGGTFGADRPLSAPIRATLRAE